MTKWQQTIMVAAATLIIASTAFSQTVIAPGHGQPAQSVADKLSANDSKFLEKAAEGSLAEVEMGKLAEQNAQNYDVKNFGERMVNDHGRANEELKQIADKAGASLPTSLSSTDKATKDHLSTMKGEAFDKSYMRHMVADHKDDLAEFQQEARDGQDEQLKDWANKMVPVLQSHLKAAEQVDAKVANEGPDKKPASVAENPPKLQ
jgi:putative membrane protein